MSAEQQIPGASGPVSAVEAPHWAPPEAPLEMPTQVLERPEIAPLWARMFVLPLVRRHG